MTGIYYSGLLQLPDFGEALCRLAVCSLREGGHCFNSRNKGISCKQTIPDSPCNATWTVPWGEKCFGCQGVIDSNFFSIHYRSNTFRSVENNRFVMKIR